MLRSIASRLFGQALCIRNSSIFSNTKSVSAWQKFSKSHFSVSFYNTLVGKNTLPMQLSYNSSPAYPMWIQKRSIVKCSKKGKRKTVKAVAKRFYRTGSGKLKYWPAGNNHKMLSKSFNMRRNLRKPRYANKQQLKVLNKMISGW